MPTDNSLQPQTIRLPIGVPIQLPVHSLDTGNGITIINQGDSTISLCSNQNFTDPVYLEPGVSIPWQTYGTCWALTTDPDNDSLLVLPDTYNYYNPSDVAIAQINQGIPKVIYPTTPASGNANLGHFYGGITPLPGQRTLIFSISWTISPVVNFVFPTLIVSGDQSNIIYYNQVPYLGETTQTLYVKNFTATVIFPIIGNLDTSFTAELINTGYAGLATSSLSVEGDIAQYVESVFYNDQATTTVASLAAAGSVIIVSGPVRLLSVSVRSGTSTALGIVGANAAELISTQGLPTGQTSTSLSFPPNTLISAGITIFLSQFGAGGTTGTATYAYP